jgi:microcystin-dependent protein
MANDFFDSTAYTSLARFTKARAEALNNIFERIVTAFDRLPTRRKLHEDRASYATDTGSANAHAVALDSVVTSYEEGLTVRFKAANANTGATTLRINGLAEVAIKKAIDDDLVANDIVVGQIVEVTFDGTFFQMTSPDGNLVGGASAAATSAAAAAASATEAGGYADAAEASADEAASIVSANLYRFCGEAGGTGNAITLTPNPAFASLSAMEGARLSFIASANNSGAVTVNVSGLGAISLKKSDGSTALTTGDIVDGTIYTIVYDGTIFYQTESAPASAGTPDDNTVSTAKIQNDAVTLAKMEHGTQGDILYYAASGVPTRLSAGTSGHVLTSGGAGANPSWAAAAGVATGSIVPYAGRSAPTGYLMCDGSAVSRVTFATLFAAICPDIGTFTVTIASPAVFTLNSHGLKTGERIRLKTTGSLPTGLSTTTDYYVNVTGSNNFSVSTTKGGANVNTSGSQSGTHTAQFFGFGAGNGSTTFNVPDLRGRAVAGADAMGGTAASRLTSSGSGIYGAALGDAGGSETHTLTISEMPAHTHTHRTDLIAQRTSGGVNTRLWESSATENTGSTGGGGAHNNTQPTMALNYIIKT